MDEEFLTELKLIRAEHSVHFSGDEMSNIVPANNRTTRSTRDPNEERKPQPDGSPRMRCLPSPGPFLPCKDLFDSWWLRAGIWSVFLLAFLGNTLVIIVLSSVRQTSSSSALTSIMWLAHSKRHIDVPRFLVINLAIADLLMAVYLGLLAFVDLSTLGEFKLHAIRWQYSTGCKLAGFLAVLSSELSVFILAIITLERNYAITNAVHLNRRLSLQKAMFIMFLGYAFALGMALMPLYGISDYRRFSVCLPLDVDSSRGSQIYVITLISINTFSFVLLLGCYLRMYFAIRGSQAWNANDLRIAKRMSILVVTDFLCWMPIIASGLTSLFGYHLIGTEGMKIMTIFILPLNSVANPFLYAITTKKFKRDLSTLQRRTRALIRLANCADNKLAGSHQHDHHQTNHHHHHHAYLTAGGYKHAASKLHCGHAAANNQQQQPKNNHYRHDLLLMSGQCRAYKGGGGAKNQSNNKLRLVSGVAHKSQAPKLAASKRQSVQRSATPLAGTCLGCSCQQRRQQQQQQDIDERPRQRAQLGPRIVLETATQTSGGQLRRQPASPPVLLRKSRSTNSGLTMMAMRRDEQQTPSTTSTPREQAWALVGVADDADREEAPAGGVLTKIEESMMMSGCDELSLHWNRQPPPPPPRSAVASCEEQAAAAVAAEEAEEHEELDDNAYREPPLAVSAGSSLLIQGAAAVRQRSCQSNHRRTEAAAAASRYYLSVDPFFIQTVAGATPTPTAGGNNNIRSASACGHLASCRGIIGADDAGVTTTLYNKCQLSNNKPSRRAGVGGSCDTMRVTSASGGVCTGAGANGDGGSGGGGPIKLSRSIQRLLFGPLAKAWSSIQISLNSSAASTHIGQQQQQQHQYHMNAADHGDGDDGQSATPLGERIDDHDADDECIDIDRMLLNGADCCLVDDILTMSSPLEGCMARIGERRMSRSCDAFIQKPNNNNDLLLGGSPSHSTSGAAGQEQSSSQGGGEYDDDRRVLLATINRLAATGSHRTRLAAGNSGRPAAAAAALVSPTPNLIGRRGGFNQRANGPGLMRGGRCMRCRSWSPALLTKLENCIYQMRSKISSGFVSQNAGATRLESAHDQQDCHSSHHSPGGANLDLVLDDEAATAKHQEASSESELELDAVDDEDVSSDDQFGGEPPTDWASRRQTISKFGRRAKRTGRLRQQSSINSDTLSTRTAGTLITNMSLSSDSSASIQMAVAAAAAAATVTRLDIITDTQGDDDDDI